MPAAQSPAATAGSYAVRGASAGASAAKTGFVTISTYVVHNPAIVKVFCFIVGIALSVCSVLAVFNVTGEKEEWKKKEIAQCVFTFFFGLVVALADGPQALLKLPQEFLFKYFFFLATNPGRASFYFYVGSITFLMMPESDLFTVIFICLGGSLAVLGLVMLILHFCSCAQPPPAGT